MGTAVIDAIKKGNIAQVKAWINDSGNPNFEFQHKSLLMYCIQENTIDIARFLIQIGANTTKAIRYGLTPLNYAISKRNSNMVELLLENGADLTMCKGLVHAVDTNCLQIVRELIKRGADVNSPNGKSYDSELPIMCAIRRNNPDILKLLLESGAKASAVGPHANKLLLKCAETWNISEVILNFLLEQGADVNCFDENGDTPLTRSVRSMNIQMTQFLIRREADLNEKNKANETPLSIALANVDFRTFRLLIQSGADPKLASKEIEKMKARDLDFDIYMSAVEKSKGVEDPEVPGTSGREASHE